MFSCSCPSPCSDLQFAKVDVIQAGIQPLIMVVTSDKGSGHSDVVCCGVAYSKTL